MAKGKEAQEQKWEIEDAAKTLTRAEEIRANKQLFAQAKKQLVKQQKVVTKVLGKGKKKEVSNA